MIRFRPQTIEEYTKIISIYSYQLLTVNASYNPSFQYMTTKKTYPDICERRANSYIYRCMIFDKLNNNSKLDSCSSMNSNSNSIQRVKCVLDFNVMRTINLEVSSQDYLLTIGKAYFLQIKNTNALSIEWNFINDGFSSKNKSLIYTPQSEGCKVVVIKIKVFAGFQLENCFQFCGFTPAPNKTKLYESSNEDEIIDGTNYGRLLSLNQSIWLIKDVQLPSPAFGKNMNYCPLGFRY